MYVLFLLRVCFIDYLAFSRSLFGDVAYVIEMCVAFYFSLSVSGCLFASLMYFLAVGQFSKVRFVLFESVLILFFL